MTSRRIPLAATMAAAVVLALTGCFAHSTPSRPVAAATTSPHPAAPTASPTPTATPSSAALPASTLLRITADAAADGGATAHLVLTVDAPTAGDGSEPGRMTAAGCDTGDWATRFPSPQWLRMHLVTTATSGTWSTQDPIEVFGSTRWDSQAWTGSWTTFEASCASGIAVIPGSAEGVAPVSAGTSTTDSTTWQSADWGFVWATDGDDPSSQHFAFTSCSIELGPAAQSDAAALTRWPDAAGYRANGDCEFGPRS
jgi:hypothetical protein